MTQSFSERHGYAPINLEVSVRDDAPPGLRTYVVDAAYRAGYTSKHVRSIAFAVLHAPIDRDIFSDRFVDDDVRNRLNDCEWFRVYDIIEALCQSASQSNSSSADADEFTDDMNTYFQENGIGWQIIDGNVETRGSELFEHGVRGALGELEATHRDTAFSELREAVRDLSRRPEPDVTGAIQHAATAMECVARDATGDSNATLGAILKRHDELIPKPLDVAVDKAWGYASDRARHMREGETPSHREAELIVAISSAVIRYLVRDEVA